MGFRARNGASAVPKTGSALHHLVTSLSVKKALKDFERISEDFGVNRATGPRLASSSGIAAVTRTEVMLPAHTRAKMLGKPVLPDCAGEIVKE